MNYCCYCMQEKDGLTHLKGFKKDIFLCLECNSVIEKINAYEFNTNMYFDFVDQIRTNYQTLKTIKKRG